MKSGRERGGWAGQNLVDAMRPVKPGNGPDPILYGTSTLTSAVLEHGLVLFVERRSVPGFCFSRTMALE
jgi:hypothetical protein